MMKGDDLRKDQAVLQMFSFMNCLWKENELKYKEKTVSCLIYKCIPIGNDVGIIEMISNCIELNKIMTLKSTLFTANCCDDQKITNKFHRLIVSSAASFIASFVCGMIYFLHFFLSVFHTKKYVICYELRNKRSS